MATKKTCHTCKFEPEWALIGAPGRQILWGQCRFKTDAKAVKKAGLPQGAQVSSPWMGQEKPKQNCPAWLQKEEVQP